MRKIESFGGGEIKFEASAHFAWVPDTRTVTYDPARIGNKAGKQAFLHELGHALLGHQKVDLGSHGDEMEREATAVGEFIAHRLGMAGSSVAS